MTLKPRPFALPLALAALLFGLAAADRAHATPLGDCNHDGETGIGELQLCINVYLGDDLGTCTPCSLDGEEVGITDLQQCINCFLDAESDVCPVAPGNDTPTVPPTSTPTPAPPTPTATPTVNSAACGNRLLESGETCASCAADCNVSNCTAVATPPRTFRVDYAPPPGQPVSAIKVRVAYRSNLMSLPGVGPTPAARIKNRPGNTTTIVNDLDYALEVTMSRSAGLAEGRLFTVDFDGCSGTAIPAVSDLSCAVLDCGSAFGSVDGCSCSVRLP